MENIEMKLLFGSAYGTYIPQMFAQELGELIENKEELKEDLETLTDPDDEWYWDAWSNVLDNAILVEGDRKLFLHESDGDLWAIPEEQREEFYNQLEEL